MSWNLGYYCCATTNKPDVQATLHFPQVPLDASGSTEAPSVVTAAALTLTGTAVPALALTGTVTTALSATTDLQDPSAAATPAQPTPTNPNAEDLAAAAIPLRPAPGKPCVEEPAVTGTEVPHQQHSQSMEPQLTLEPSTDPWDFCGMRESIRALQTDIFANAMQAFGRTAMAVLAPPTAPAPARSERVAKEPERLLGSHGRRVRPSLQDDDTVNFNFGRAVDWVLKVFQLPPGLKPKGFQKLREAGYTGYRTVRSEGNCLFRAVGFYLVEQVVSGVSEDAVRWYGGFMGQLESVMYDDPQLRLEHQELLGELRELRRLRSQGHQMMDHGMCRVSCDVRARKVFEDRTKTNDQAMVRALRQILGNYIITHLQEGSAEGPCVDELVMGGDAEKLVREQVLPMGVMPDSEILVACLARALGIVVHIANMERSGEQIYFKLYDGRTQAEVEAAVAAPTVHMIFCYCHHILYHRSHDIRVGRQPPDAAAAGEEADPSPARIAAKGGDHPHIPHPADHNTLDHTIVAVRADHQPDCQTLLPPEAACVDPTAAPSPRRTASLTCPPLNLEDLPSLEDPTASSGYTHSLDWAEHLAMLEAQSKESAAPYGGPFEDPVLWCHSPTPSEFANMSYSEQARFTMLPPESDTDEHDYMACLDDPAFQQTIAAAEEGIGLNTLEEPPSSLELEQDGQPPCDPLDQTIGEMPYGHGRFFHEPAVRGTQPRSPVRCWGFAIGSAASSPAASQCGPLTLQLRALDPLTLGDTDPSQEPGTLDLWSPEDAERSDPWSHTLPLNLTATRCML